MESVCGLLSDKQYDGQNCGGKLILLSVSGKKKFRQIIFLKFENSSESFVYSIAHVWVYTSRKFSK